MVKDLELNKSMGAGKHKSIEELNILDDFLFNELIMSERYGREFLEYFLKTILNTDIVVKDVHAQAIHSGGDPNNKGIRMDVLIEGEISAGIEYGQKNQKTTIDVEMQKQPKDVQKGKKNDLRRRSRVYQAFRDVKMLKAGETYGNLKNILIIICTPFDIFGRNRMKYTFENCCVEEPDLRMEDGAVRIFLFTKGKRGSTEEMEKMLKYVEESIEKNAVSTELEYVHKMVMSVKQDKKVGAKYMWVIEREMELLEEGREEGELKGGIKTLIQDNLEENIPLERILEKLRKRFNLSEENAKEEFEKYSNKVV